MIMHHKLKNFKINYNKFNQNQINNKKIQKDNLMRCHHNKEISFLDLKVRIYHTNHLSKNKIMLLINFLNKLME